MAGIEANMRQDIAPTVIEPTDIDAAAAANPVLGPAASAMLRYLASFAMTALATVAAVGINSKVAIPNLSLVFVIPVIVAGLSFGLGPSFLSAVLGALAFNFFLTEPRYSLSVDDPANIWAIGLLFVVGLVVSGVAFTSHQRAAEVSRLNRQAIVLQGYSRDVAAADSVKAIVSLTCRALAALFHAPVVVMLVSGDKVILLEKTGDAELQEPELEAARASLATGGTMRGGVYPDIASRFDFWPVQAAGDSNAVLGIAFDPDERPVKPDVPVNVVRSVLAMGLALQHARPTRDVELQS